MRFFTSAPDSFFPLMQSREEWHGPTHEKAGLSWWCRWLSRVDAGKEPPMVVVAPASELASLVFIAAVNAY